MMRGEPTHCAPSFRDAIAQFAARVSQPAACACQTRGARGVSKR